MLALAVRIGKARLIDNRVLEPLRERSALADEGPQKRMKTRWSDSLRRYFLAGLLVFLPVAITLVVYRLGDRSYWIACSTCCRTRSIRIPICLLRFLNSARSLPICLILFLGVLTRGVATRRFLAAWESIFIQIPVFRGVYTAVQKLVQTFLGPIERAAPGRDDRISAYRRVYTVGFAMGRAWSHLEEKKNAQLVNVFVPTTPNPTSGFFLLVPSNEVTPLNMTHGRSAQADHLERSDHA